MEFSKLYRKVSGIVHRARKDYYIKLWEKDDWDQEGMLVLHQLLSQHPQLASDDSSLYRYYKVKFRNHIKDVIRKQESQKRRFDRMAHEDLDTLSHLVASPGLMNDELVILRGMLRDYRHQLPASQQANYDQLISGGRFKGRRTMLSDLKSYLSDYKPN